MKETQLYVISHTHWDREWYEEFQEYRARLVRMMDDLIVTMENDEEYKFFHFDGQTIVIEDYLKIRPQNEERLLNLIKQGRIIIGPWYVMPDSFLVSGESLIRNLGKGIGICKKIGVPPMNSGYMPDLFGHNNQFPQLLRGFSIDNAILFRGIADYEKDAFNWKGADNSEITVLKLDKDRCYSNFYFAVRWPFDGREFDRAEQTERMKKLLHKMEGFATSNVMLMLDGVDHSDIEPQLPQIIKELEADIPNVKFYHATFAEYMEAFKKTEPVLETIEGSLYNVGGVGLNNSVLKNVLSSLVHIKQANDKCETLLTRQVEPLNAFLSILKENNQLPYDKNEMNDRQGFIDEAWEYLLKNHPHDSICGCSISNVHYDNEYRFRQTEAICRTMSKNMGDILAKNICTTTGGKDGAVVVFNASQSPVDGLVVTELSVPAAHQENFVFYNALGEKIPVQILERSARTDHIYNLRELIRFESRCILKAVLPLSIPANGYTTVTYDNLISQAPGENDYEFIKYFEPTRLKGTLRTGLRTFDTGKIEVTFKTDGTLDVLEKASGKCYRDVFATEDTGDMGDGYNYVSPMQNSKYIGSYAEMAIESDGPLAVVVKLIVRMNLPKHYAYNNPLKRDAETTEQELVSYVTLLKDSDKIDVKTVVNNQCLHHRMRVLVPTYAETDCFYTKTPFAMTKWDINIPNWETAKEVETFVRPSQGVTFIKDETSAVALYAKGLYEVSVSEDPSHTIALTLYRSTTNEVCGSTGEIGHMKREMQFEYCIEFNHKQSLQDAFITGENWRSGLYSFKADIHEGVLPAENSFIDLGDNTNMAFSSFTSQLVTDENGAEKKAFVLRLVDVSGVGAAGTAVLQSNIKEAFYVDFNGVYIADTKFDKNTVTYKADANKIINIALCF